MSEREDQARRGVVKYLSGEWDVDEFMGRLHRLAWNLKPGEEGADFIHRLEGLLAVFEDDEMSLAEFDAELREALGATVDVKVTTHAVANRMAELRPLMKPAPAVTLGTSREAASA